MTLFIVIKGNCFESTNSLILKINSLQSRKGYNFCCSATELYFCTKITLVKGLLLTLFLTFLLINLWGQTFVQVMNAKTGQAVEGVILLSDNFSTQTNSEGKAKLDARIFDCFRISAP